LGSDPEGQDRAQVIIRAAEPGDAGRIAVLCRQLGYPTPQEEVERRIEHIRQREEHAIYVAQRTSGEVIGWVHVSAHHLLLAAPHAQIGGLVVHEDHRRLGVGRLLMERAERWARERGCQAVSLRSNVIRREAHAFYEAIGYRHIKTQRAFRKLL
jgi:GNAT superfamily N-acetyltransferase